jgi:NAD(P)-dependent dehydrogenase (short-subunit alcohol dehydrogenase family)
MGRVQDKIAIITGGAGGLGSAAARLLAKEGAKVTITDVAETQGNALARQIGADFLSHEVSSEEQWGQVVSAVDRKYGAIHVLVNAAGIEGSQLGPAGTPETTTLEEWRRVHAINLDGTFLGCRAVLPIMKRGGEGSIVNISSIVSFMGTPASAAYGSSKAGVQQLTKSVALHGSRDNKRIRCNSIHPGLIRTRMLDNIYAEFGRSLGRSAEEGQKASAKHVPLRTIGEPDDIAYMILFLASDESKYVTGSEFMVDGGWHLVDAE